MPTTPRATSGQFATTAFTVLVTGSRDWDKIEAVRDEIVKIKDLAQSLGFTPSQVTLVHGNAKGADRIASTFAAMVGFNVVSVPADWKSHYYATVDKDEEPKQLCRCDLATATYCKMAGIVRNLKMLDTYKPDMVLAFNRDSSAGTMHTISESRKRGLITTVIRYESDEVSATASEDVAANSDGSSHPRPAAHSSTEVTDDPFVTHNV
ncbi:MAG TPA: DUF2493 domain-containing protein [Patescibacteria group bacterium]|nr:DUF2493 domain-containing protein [Patescibacteria group bacterium]